MVNKLVVSYDSMTPDKWLVVVEEAFVDVEDRIPTYDTVFTFTMKHSGDLCKDEERMFRRTEKEFPDAVILWKGAFEDMYSTEKITDKASDRGSYAAKCENLADVVFEHIAKICIWRNSRDVEHWKDEIFGWLSVLMKAKVKNDNHANTVRNKCFKDAFIFSNFDDDFGNYEDVAPTWFRIAIIRENKNYRDFDINKLVTDSKEEIISFFSGLSHVFESGDLDILRKYVDML